MGYAIFRVAKRKTGSSVAAMSRHALRETAVPNAIAGGPKPEVLAGARSTQELMQALHAGIAQAKALGGSQGFTKASTPVLDILVTTSADDAGRIGKAGQDDYFRRGLAYIAQAFGGRANILTACVHRDETTPHLQVLVMPLDRETNRFAASKMIGGPVGLSEHQDKFHEAAGKPHGLLRGEKRSRAKHVPVRALYAAMNAGHDAPKAVEVPPAPGMIDRLKPDYLAKKKAHEDALAANAAQREKLLAQAKAGRMMHPALMARQAERYRENVRREDLVKASQAAAAWDRKAAEAAKAVQVDILHWQQASEAETRLLAQGADRMWEKSGAQLLDKFSRHWSPEFVGRLARHLKIELVVGKPVLDQIRRAGVANSMIAAANRVAVFDSTIMASAQTWQEQQTQRPQERGG
jgi:hypothetical protein